MDTRKFYVHRQLKKKNVKTITERQTAKKNSDQIQFSEAHTQKFIIRRTLWIRRRRHNDSFLHIYNRNIHPLSLINEKTYNIADSLKIIQERSLGVTFGTVLDTRHTYK